MLQLRVSGSGKTYALTKKTVVGSDASAHVVLEGDDIKGGDVPSVGQIVFGGGRSVGESRVAVQVAPVDSRTILRDDDRGWM